MPADASNPCIASCNARHPNTNCINSCIDQFSDQQCISSSIGTWITNEDYGPCYPIYVPTNNPTLNPQRFVCGDGPQGQALKSISLDTCCGQCYIGCDNLGRTRNCSLHYQCAWTTEWDGPTRTPREFSIPYAYASNPSETLDQICGPSVDHVISAVSVRAWDCAYTVSNLSLDFCNEFDSTGCFCPQAVHTPNVPCAATSYTLPTCRDLLTLCGPYGVNCTESCSVVEGVERCNANNCVCQEGTGNPFNTSGITNQACSYVNTGTCGPSDMQSCGQFTKSCEYWTGVSTASLPQVKCDCFEGGIFAGFSWCGGFQFNTTLQIEGLAATLRNCTNAELANCGSADGTSNCWMHCLNNGADNCVVVPQSCRCQNGSLAEFNATFGGYYCRGFAVSSPCTPSQKILCDIGLESSCVQDCYLGGCRVRPQTCTPTVDVPAAPCTVFNATFDLRLCGQGVETCTIGAKYNSLQGYFAPNVFACPQPVTVCNDTAFVCNTTTALCSGTTIQCTCLFGNTPLPNGAWNAVNNYGRPCTLPQQSPIYCQEFVNSAFCQPGHYVRDCTSAEVYEECPLLNPIGCSKFCPADPLSGPCVRQTDCYTLDNTCLADVCSPLGTRTCQSFFNVTSGQHELVPGTTCLCNDGFSGTNCSIVINRFLNCSTNELLRYCGAAADVNNCRRVLTPSDDVFYQCLCNGTGIIPSGIHAIDSTNGPIFTVPQICGARARTCNALDITRHLGSFGASCSLACNIDNPTVCSIRNYTCVKQGCIPYAPDMDNLASGYFPDANNWINYYNETLFLRGLNGSRPSFGLCGLDECDILTTNLTAAPDFVTDAGGLFAQSVTAHATVTFAPPGRRRLLDISGTTTYSALPAYGVPFQCLPGYANNATNGDRCDSPFYYLDCPLNSLTLGFYEFCSSQCQLICDIRLADATTATILQASGASNITTICEYVTNPCQFDEQFSGPITDTSERINICGTYVSSATSTSCAHFTNGRGVYGCEPAFTTCECKPGGTAFGGSLPCAYQYVPTPCSLIPGLITETCGVNAVNCTAFCDANVLSFPPLQQIKHCSGAQSCQCNSTYAAFNGTSFCGQQFDPPVCDTGHASLPNCGPFALKAILNCPTANATLDTTNCTMQCICQPGTGAYPGSPVPCDAYNTPCYPEEAAATCGSFAYSCIRRCQFNTNIGYNALTHTQCMPDASTCTRLPVAPVNRPCRPDEFALCGFSVFNCTINDGTHIPRCQCGPKAFPSAFFACDTWNATVPPGPFSISPTTCGTPLRNAVYRRYVVPTSAQLNQLQYLYPTLTAQFSSSVNATTFTDPATDNQVASLVNPYAFIHRFKDDFEGLLDIIKTTGMRFGITLPLLECECGDTVDGASPSIFVTPFVPTLLEGAFPQTTCNGYQFPQHAVASTPDTLAQPLSLLFNTETCPSENAPVGRRCGGRGSCIALANNVRVGDSTLYPHFPTVDDSWQCVGSSCAAVPTNKGLPIGQLPIFPTIATANITPGVFIIVSDNAGTVQVVSDPTDAYYHAIMQLPLPSVTIPTIQGLLTNPTVELVNVSDVVQQIQNIMLATAPSPASLAATACFTAAQANRITTINAAFKPCQHTAGANACRNVLGTGKTTFGVDYKTVLRACAGIYTNPEPGVSEFCQPGTANSCDPDVLNVCIPGNLDPTYYQNLNYVCGDSSCSLVLQTPITFFVDACCAQQALVVANNELSKTFQYCVADAAKYFIGNLTSSYALVTVPGLDQQVFYSNYPSPFNSITSIGIVTVQDVYGQYVQNAPYATLQSNPKTCFCYNGWGNDGSGKCTIQQCCTTKTGPGDYPTKCNVNVATVACVSILWRQDASEFKNASEFGTLKVPCDAGQSCDTNTVIQAGRDYCVNGDFNWRTENCDCDPGWTTPFTTVLIPGAVNIAPCTVSFCPSTENGICNGIGLCDLAGSSAGLQGYVCYCPDGFLQPNCTAVPQPSIPVGLNTHIAYFNYTIRQYVCAYNPQGTWNGTFCTQFIFSNGSPLPASSPDADFMWSATGGGGTTFADSVFVNCLALFPNGDRIGPTCEFSTCPLGSNGLPCNGVGTCRFGSCVSCGNAPVTGCSCSQSFAQCINPVNGLRCSGAGGGKCLPVTNAFGLTHSECFCRQDRYGTHCEFSHCALPFSDPTVDNCEAGGQESSCVCDSPGVNCRCQCNTPSGCTTSCNFNINPGYYANNPVLNQGALCTDNVFSDCAISTGSQETVCSNRGACTKTAGVYSCHCQAGYHGSFCQFQDCAVPCGQHGQCLDQTPAVCQCFHHWGSPTSTPPCSNNLCGNAFPSGDGFNTTCVCANPLFQPNSCSSLRCPPLSDPTAPVCGPVNPLFAENGLSVSYPCNNGTCSCTFDGTKIADGSCVYQCDPAHTISIKGPTGFKACGCAAGFDPNNFCRGTLCLNGGTPVPTNASACTCPDGFAGPLCQFLAPPVTTIVNSTVPCGTVTPPVTTTTITQNSTTVYIANCIVSGNPTMNITTMTDPPSQYLCNNQGTFNSSTGSCVCYTGLTGPNCTINACQNGGTAVLVSTGGACLCAAGFAGTFCTDPLCQNGGVLNLARTGCICPAQYTDPTCSTLLCNSPGVFNASIQACQCPAALGLDVAGQCTVDLCGPFANKTSSTINKCVCFANSTKIPVISPLHPFYCELTCINGGVYQPPTLRCQCPSNFTGAICNINIFVIPSSSSSSTGMNNVTSIEPPSLSAVDAVVVMTVVFGAIIIVLFLRFSTMFHP